MLTWIVTGLSPTQIISENELSGLSRCISSIGKQFATNVSVSCVPGKGRECRAGSGVYSVGRRSSVGRA